MVGTINPKVLKEKRQEYVVIDVREAEELNEGTIEGYIHMPLGMLIKKAKKGMIEELKEKKICTHCSGGYRSNIVADELTNGVSKQFQLKGALKLGNKTNRILNN